MSSWRGDQEETSSQRVAERGRRLHNKTTLRESGREKRGEHGRPQASTIIATSLIDMTAAEESEDEQAEF